jgi:replication initiation and membrane attachment protein DnaB
LLATVAAEVTFLTFDTATLACEMIRHCDNPHEEYQHAVNENQTKSQRGRDVGKKEPEWDAEKEKETEQQPSVCREP